MLKTTIEWDLQKYLFYLYGDILLIHDMENAYLNYIIALVWHDM